MLISSARTPFWGCACSDLARFELVSVDMCLQDVRIRIEGFSTCQKFGEGFQQLLLPLRSGRAQGVGICRQDG